MLKLDKFNKVKDEQELNMVPIFVDCEVSKLEKSIEVNDEQLANITPILITCEVSKLDKSISVILVQPENILTEVFILLSQINSMKLIV